MDTYLDFDWKLNPNVQARITLHKLDYKEYKGESGNYFHQRNIPSTQIMETEDDPLSQSTLNSQSDQDNAENFHEKFKKILSQCDGECSLCSNFINQLSLHILDSHNVELEAIQRTRSEIKSRNYHHDETQIHVPGIDGSPCQFDNAISLDKQNSVKCESTSEIYIERSAETEKNQPDTKMFYISNIIKTEPNELNDMLDSENKETMETEFIPDELGCTDQLGETDIAVNMEESMTQAQRVLIYFCEQCNLSFTDKTILMEHNDRIHKEKDTVTDSEHNSQESQPIIKPHKCNICSKSYRLINNLIRHRKIKHPSSKNCFCSTNNKQSQQKSHKCKTCDKIFSTPPDLSQHMHICDNGKARRAQHNCEIAGVSAVTVDKLNGPEYSLNVGNVGKVIMPPNIRAITLADSTPRHGHSSASELERALQEDRPSRILPRDINLIHTEGKLYMCDICGRAFKKEMSLKCHMLGHTTEKVNVPRPYRIFPCQFCEKRFLKINSLQSHQHQVHRGEEG